jgi:hypothetical protein
MPVALASGSIGVVRRSLQQRQPNARFHLPMMPFLYRT